MPDRARRRCAASTLVALLAVLVAGCGSSIASIAPTASTGFLAASASPTETTTAVTASPTIGAGSSLPAPTDPVITIGDDARRILLYLPETTPPHGSPLVLFLHAAGGTPASAARETRLGRLVAEGAIVAFPPAQGSRWQAQVTPGLTDRNEDERFLAGLLDHLTAQYRVDPDRVFVAGFSMGAVMTGRMACRFADRIAAAAIVSGAPWIGACRPSRPVSILVLHGTGDSTFRYDGAEALIETWRTLDQCPPPADPEPLTGRATRVASGPCADGTAVDLVAVDNGPHAWFAEPDATGVVSEFFAAHGRR